MTFEIKVPEMGESVVEATVARWLVKEGDPVQAGKPVVELETDKVDLEVAADRDGVLASIGVPEGADVQVGDVLGTIEEGEEGEKGTEGTEGAEGTGGTQGEETERGQVEAAPAPGSAGDGKVTPVARRMAADAGVDLARISGSGSGGRITKEDVTQYLQGREEQVEEAAAPTPQPVPTTPALEPLPATFPSLFVRPDAEREERVKMSRRRRTIARRLVEAQHTAAMLTTFNEIDMHAIIDLRVRRRASFEEQFGVRLGFMSFTTKAVIAALKAFPLLNAEIDGDDIIIKHYYDIGIAVGAAEGLVVPVLRDADRMSFAEIEVRIRELARKAQEGSLSLADLQGGSFTITNGGVFGSLLSTPILNPPQVGILGLHKIEERPVVVDGEIVVRPMMYVALSYDHRIVDGREAVQFLVKVKDLMEDPERLLLEG